MTENTTTENVNFRDVMAAQLAEDIAKAEAKLQKLRDKLANFENEAANEERIAALAEGDAISYGYGRAATRKIRSGIIRAVAKNDKGLVQLKVETGEGFESEFNIIDSGAVLFTTEQLEAEQARIDAAVKEAAEAAAAAAKKAAEGGAE